MSEIVATTSGLIIDSEFESLIPKLADNEYEGLKEDIKNRGCRDPVVVWKGQNIVLDGHHRYRICTKLGIPFKIEEYEFPNRTAAKIFMFTNQNSRRNLNPSQLAMLALKLEALYSEQAKERQGIRTDLGQEINESERGSSAEKAAKVMGICPQSVAYAKRVDKKGIPELAELVRSGKVAVSAAARVADEPPEVQKSVVDEARTQIQEGKKPNIGAILGKMLSETDDLPKEDSAVSEAIEITNLPMDIPEELKEEWKTFNEFCDSINVPLEERGRSVGK